MRCRVVGKSSFKSSKSGKQLFLLDILSAYSSDQGIGERCKNQFVNETHFTSAEIGREYDIYFNDRGFVDTFLPVK